VSYKSRTKACGQADAGHCPRYAKKENYRVKKIIFGICILFILSINVWADEVKNVVVETLAKSSSSWDGNVLPNYPKGKPEITILRIKIPAGAELPIHEHPVINAGVLLSGELTVVAKDKKKLHLKAGDSIVEVVNKAHYGKNEGTNAAEIIVFYAGTVDKTITVK
jgi:quercetin dioxygenase-like cupin family protein